MNGGCVAGVPNLSPRDASAALALVTAASESQYETVGFFAGKRGWKSGRPSRWAGLEVCGFSLVTNAGAGYTGEPLSHEEVLAAGAEAGPRLARVIRRFVADLGA